jgi:hypothetical protein
MYLDRREFAALIMTWKQTTKMPERLVVLLQQVMDCICKKYGVSGDAALLCWRGLPSRKRSG